MVTANVNGTAVKIPDRFTVDEWVSLQKWDFDIHVQWPYILEHITEIDNAIYKKANPESLILFIGFVVSSVNKRQRIDLPDFNNLKFGQFVDLDCFISLGIEKHLNLMLEVLGIDTPWASEALWAIEQYIKWRTTIYRKYQQLFGLNDRY
jgi:hypothetical protein